MTLFTKSPTYPRGVNSVLRELYGVEDEERDSKKSYILPFQDIEKTLIAVGLAIKLELIKKKN